MTAHTLERLSKTEAAAYLDVTPRTLDRWHSQRVGPPRVKIGAKVWYLRDSLDDWIRSQEVAPVRVEARQ